MLSKAALGQFTKIEFGAIPNQLDEPVLLPSGKDQLKIHSVINKLITITANKILAAARAMANVKVIILEKTIVNT